MNNKDLRYHSGGDNFDTGYEPEVGSFALAKKRKDGFQRNSEWMDCRETFDNSWRRSKSGIFFFKDDEKGNNGKGARVAAFFNLVEEKLNIKPRSQFFSFKNVRNVTGVKFSKWWIENAARRQLFTILLRCGVAFTGKNFNRALYYDQYAKDTRPAIEKFFQGFTHCQRQMNGWNGWVTFFGRGNPYARRTEKEIQSRLNYLKSRRNKKRVK